MKHGISLIAVGVAGLVTGILGTNILAAATTVPKAYLIANIFDVKDSAMLKKYQAVAPGINAAFGGQVLVRGSAVQVDPSWTPPTGTIVLLQFPDLQHLKDWYNSPAYAKIKGLREKSSTTHEYAVEALAPH